MYIHGSVGKASIIVLCIINSSIDACITLLMFTHEEPDHGLLHAFALELASCTDYGGN